MIEKREKEWQEIEQKALQMLKSPRLLPKDEVTKNFNPILHLWIDPSFKPQKHWFFYKPNIQLNPQPKPFVRELFWDRQNPIRSPAFTGPGWSVAVTLSGGLELFSCRHHARRPCRLRRRIAARGFCLI